MPRERIPVKGGGVTDGVVRECSCDNIILFDLCQLIFPCTCTISVTLGFCYGSKSSGGIRIRLLARAISAVVVSVHIGLAQHLVVLAEKLAEIVVDVGDFLTVSIYDLGDVAVHVVGVGIGRVRVGAGGNYRRGVLADQRGGVGRGCAEGVPRGHDPARRGRQGLARRAVEGLPATRRAKCSAGGGYDQLDYSQVTKSMLMWIGIVIKSSIVFYVFCFPLVIISTNVTKSR